MQVAVCMHVCMGGRVREVQVMRVGTGLVAA